MDESPEEIQQKRNELQKKANALKEQRNQLHLKSKHLAEERDQLNAEIRGMRNQIAEHKKKRDELNERVQHSKEQRNKLNKGYRETKKKIDEIERSRSSALGTNLNVLRKQLRTMETEQMTKPMSPQKEKKLIDVISELATRIKEQEEILNQDPKLKKALEEEKIIKQKAEKQHDLVEKLAKRAQEEHENMMKLVKQLDNYVKKVNMVQESIVMTKIEADRIHKEFIESVDQIHAYEREITSEKDKRFKKKKSIESAMAHKEANEIFERFKKGEKLSTEDLMALQKAGLI